MEKIPSWKLHDIASNIKATPVFSITALH